ncbi:MAG TPA: TerB N-terminal domain-containing protein [Candidatus Paceibacterota bacterium]|nr:TerB N-terminal domain-containing protein [Candidatus Paceibacterota bacterium]
MNFFNKFLRLKNNLLVISNLDISESIYIPEPTKSLLWVTNEDISKISSPFQIKITFDLNQGKSEINDGHNFFGEPSLIWTKLPIEKNNELENKPMYYPSYSSLSPKNRYQYLNWLRDITQPTNLSYVFLYYYGLERQLLIGNFDLAVQEIFKLLKYHDKGTFRAYAQNALIVSALYKNRTDIFEENSFLFESVSNESLIVRKKFGYKLTAVELMNLSYSLKLKNKRYIKLYPEDFVNELDKLLISYEKNNGSLLDIVSLEEMKFQDSMVFANGSLPKNIRTIKVPQLILNPKFRDMCLSLLEKAHENLKIKHTK